MLFNSFEFLLFFSSIFFLYWFISKTKGMQNTILLIANIVFYACFDWRFLLLLFCTITISYFSAIYIVKDNINRNKWFYLGVIVNIGILMTFKYLNFFVESFILLSNKLGFQTNDITLNLILPIGISFYTFQSLNYIFDVYKNKMEPTYNYIILSNYISFFPLISSGPIERARNIIPQLNNIRHFKYSDAVEGCKSILWGLFKKKVIADNCAIAVDHIFSNYSQLDSITLIYGMVLYSVQIYADFSGYSNMAIGISRLLGIKVINNFSMPYLARNISEFWRKWHISLTSWFTEYLYIPLGGSRCSRGIQFRNTMIVFVISGLWHGANWTYVIWGIYHGLLFIPIVFGKTHKYKDIVSKDRTFPSLHDLTHITFTFILVAIGWIIFRSSDINMAITYIHRMLTEWTLSMPVYGKSCVIWIIILLIIEWFSRDKEDVYLYHFSNKYLRIFSYILMAYLIITASGNTSSFIYFQF